MLLYHYTKIDASINIIRNGLCFWGFRYDSMNDPTDYIFARDIILPKLLQKQPEEDRSDYLTIYPYIVSFCTERDFEIMWRLYQGEVALVIDSEKLPFEEWDKEGDISEDTLYNKVMYATEESIESVAKELYENRREILNDATIDEYQLSVLPFIKHKAYEIEHEFRLAKVDYDSFTAKYNPHKPDKCDIYEGEVPKNIKCLDAKDGTLRLYKEFHLPKECLVGIIIHTFDDKKFKTQKKHFELWLIQNGFSIQNIKIEKTQSYPVR